MTVWILEDEAATSIATKDGRTTHIVLSAADPLDRDSEGIHHYGNDIIRASLLVFPFFPFSPEWRAPDSRCREHRPLIN